MDWSALYTGVGTAVAAIGGAAVWFEKRVLPQIEAVNEAVNADPHAKLAVADVQAAFAAKDSATRDAEIKAAVTQGLLALKSPSAQLSSLERVWLQDFASKVVPADLRSYVNTQTVDGVLQGLPAVMADAQAGEWYKAIQQVAATVTQPSA